MTQPTDHMTTSTGQVTSVPFGGKTLFCADADASKSNSQTLSGWETVSASVCVCVSHVHRLAACGQGQTVS